MTAPPACRCLPIICLLAFGAAVAMADPPLTAQQKERLKQRDSLYETMKKLRASGETAQAIAVLEYMLVINRDVFGDFHLDVAGALEQLADLLERQNDFAAARKARQEVQAIETKLHGPNHYRVADARLGLANIALLEKLGQPDRDKLIEANQLFDRFFQATGNLRQALPLVEKALALRLEVLGEQHMLTTQAAIWNGWAQRKLKNPAKAEPLLKLAIDARKKLLGEKHPEYAAALSNLADLYEDMDQNGKAEPLALQALAIRKEVFGAKHPDYLVALSNLTILYANMEQYDKAITACRELVELHLAIDGKQHPRYRDMYGRLASLLGRLANDLEQPDITAVQVETARKARAEALAIQSELHGAQHWEAIDAAVALARTETWGRLKPEERRLLIEARRLMRQGSQLESQDQLPEAAAAMEKALAIRKQVLGEEHLDCARSLHNLADLCQTMADYARAESCYQQAVRIKKHVLGERHPDFATILNDLGGLYVARGQHRQAEPLLRQALDLRKELLDKDDLDCAQSLNGLANLYFAIGDYDQAEPLYQQAAAIYKQGGQHSDHATSLNNLAGLYRIRGAYAQAEPLMLQALAIRKRALGETHYACANSLNSLGLLYLAMGDLAKAEPLFRQALKIYQAARGEQHTDCADSLNNLALVAGERGDYPGAERLYRQAQAIHKQFSGESHPAYATGLNNLAGLYKAMGDFAKAEPLYRQALDIRKRVLGPMHARYAESLNNLALFLSQAGESAKAEPLFLESLDINRQVLGERHPHYAASLNNLALLYSDRGDHVRAEPLFQQALAINESTIGAHHLHTALSQRNLARLYSAQGNYAKAEPLFRQALNTFKHTLDEKHYYHGVCLNGLAVLYARMGDPARAEPLFRQSLNISRDVLELAAAGQSERQQREMAAFLRFQLNAYLTMTVDARGSAREAYASVIPWKGSVLQGQSWLRLQRHRPELRDRFLELERVTRRLAALAYALPERVEPNTPQEIQRLSERKEQLEAELAGQSQEFRQQQARARMTPEQIQAALPAGVILIDFLEYQHTRRESEKGPPIGEQHMAAFVVRRETIELIDLGAVQPISAAIETWRKTFGRGDAGAQAGQELRRLVWNKLAPHLHGANAVLISPDGATARFPWAALPGQQPGRYLLEELAVAVVPVPQMLPQILGGGDPPAADASLLLVGGVQFNAAPAHRSIQDAVLLIADVHRNPLQTLSLVPGLSSESAPRGSLGQWADLPGTLAEVEAIHHTFGQEFPAGIVTELRGPWPTRDALNAQTPRYRYLHLATHGYFAPPMLRSALTTTSRGEQFVRHDVTGFHPGLLSGLVLAGANRSASLGQDHGILTALEVAELDLRNTDLVVLSACETGLGEIAGGEGLLGLQRAFQTAGARTTVASLWSVDDAATQQLMTHFYDNLWKKKLPKLEAMRQAQLAMLQGRGGSSTGRGLDLLEPEPGEMGSARISPRLWAAWVLSGDPGIVRPIKFEPSETAKSA